MTSTEPIATEQTADTAREKQLLVEQEKTTALKLWMADVGFREIGEHIGRSTGTAWTRVQTAIDDMRPHLEYDKYRSEMLAELDIARRAIRRRVVDPKETTKNLADAIGTLIKIQDQIAKLIGLDKAPTPEDELRGLGDDQLRAAIVEQIEGDPELQVMIDRMRADGTG